MYLHTVLIYNSIIYIYIISLRKKNSEFTRLNPTRETFFRHLFLHISKVCGDLIRFYCGQVSISEEGTRYNWYRVFGASQHTFILFLRIYPFLSFCSSVVFFSVLMIHYASGMHIFRDVLKIYNNSLFHSLTLFSHMSWIKQKLIWTQV